MWRLNLRVVSWLAVSALFIAGTSGPVLAASNCTSFVANANLSGCDLQNANLSGLNLSGANLIGANLAGANLQNTNLTDAVLKDANLTNANLSGAILKDAMMKSANLTGANLTGANLVGAMLKSALLVNANLTDANFTDANLQGANLTGSIRSGTIFTGANLNGAVIPVGPPPPPPPGSGMGRWMDSVGNYYIADGGNNAIRRVDAVTGIITTVAGKPPYDGNAAEGILATETAGAAGLFYPSDVIVDSKNDLYIADNGNFKIRKVDFATGIMTTFMGNGVQGRSGDGGLAKDAQISHVFGMALDGSGNLFVADYENKVIRKVSAATGLVSTIAGTGVSGYSGDGGPALAANIRFIGGIAVNSAGDLFFVDKVNHVVRKVSAAGIISTVAGSVPGGANLGDGGLATAAKLDLPRGLGLDAAGNLYICSATQVRKVDMVTGIITTVAGNGSPGYSGDGGLATDAMLGRIMGGVNFDPAGNMYIVASDGSTIRKVDAVTRIITTVAGQRNVVGFFGDGGQANAAKLFYPFFSFPFYGGLDG